MKFTLKNVIKVAKEKRACSITKELKKYHTIQDIIKHYDQKTISFFAYWLARRWPEWRPNLIKYVTDSKWAYWWAVNMGDHEIMRDRVTDSEWAFRWAYDIGNREIMRDRVTDSQWAYCWAYDIGDREVMRDRVTESQWAYWWAVYMGDHEIMRDRIIDAKWIEKWIEDFPEDEVYFKNKGLL